MLKFKRAGSASGYYFLGAEAFEVGVSSRDQRYLFNKAVRTSHGEVSKLWQKEGERCVEELRNLDLSKENYVVLTLVCELGFWSLHESAS